jgi:hypothetical protein
MRLLTLRALGRGLGVNCDIDMQSVWFAASGPIGWFVFLSSDRGRGTPKTPERKNRLALASREASDAFEGIEQHFVCNGCEMGLGAAGTDTHAQEVVVQAELLEHTLQYYAKAVCSDFTAAHTSDLRLQASECVVVRVKHTDTDTGATAGLGNSWSGGETLVSLSVHCCRVARNVWNEVAALLAVVLPERTFSGHVPLWHLGSLRLKLILTAIAAV